MQKPCYQKNDLKIWSGSTTVRVASVGVAGRNWRATGSCAWMRMAGRAPLAPDRPAPRGKRGARTVLTQRVASGCDERCGT